MSFIHIFFCNSVLKMAESNIDSIENLREKWKNILDNEGGKLKIDSQLNNASAATSTLRANVSEPLYESSSKNVDIEELVAPIVEPDSQSQSVSTNSSNSTLLIIGLIAIVIFALLLLWSTRSSSDDDVPRKAPENLPNEKFSFEFDEKEEEDINIPVKTVKFNTKSEEVVDREREDDLGKKSQRERVYGQIPPNIPRAVQNDEDSKPNIRISTKNEDPLFQTLRQ